MTNIIGHSFPYDDKSKIKINMILNIAKVLFYKGNKNLKWRVILTGSFIQKSKYLFLQFSVIILIPCVIR